MPQPDLAPGRTPPATSAAEWALPLGIFLAWGFLLAWPSLSYPMAFDDLVLLRRYSMAEIAGSFVGQWDPEALMTQGLRPVTVVFNHLRQLLLGEHVVGHRLLLVGLYAAFSTLMVRIARRLGMALGPAVASQALAMGSVYSTFHYVWLTDGNHLVQGLAFGAAVLLLFDALDRPSWPRAAGSMVAFLAGLLTREDTVAAAPALLLLGWWYTRSRGRNTRHLGVYSGVLVALVAAFFLYRRRVLASWAPQPGHDLPGVLHLALRASNPCGLATFDTVGAWLRAGWWAGLVLAGLALLWPHRRLDWRTPALWLAAALLACSPGLTLRRDDLVFFAVSFMAVASVAALWEAARLGRTARALAVAILVIGLAGGMRAGRVFAENFHPASLRALWWNARYVYGAYAQRAGGRGLVAWKEVIPAPRRRMLVDQLSTVGIGDDWQARHKIPSRLVPEALARGWRRPAEGRPFFYPWLPWDED